MHIYVGLGDRADNGRTQVALIDGPIIGGNRRRNHWRCDGVVRENERPDARARRDAFARRTGGLPSPAEPHSTETKREHIMAIAQRSMTRAHQPDQAMFRSILPEDVDWRPFPAFPPSARLAVLVGHPNEPGPYVIRVKVPGGTKLMPHRHPEDRVYTVIAGVFYIGLGDQFDGDKVQAYPPGSVIVLPGDTSHFHWAKSGEYITQVTAIGPLGLEYLNPRDDPRASK
jgi:quercetin dioxygenase-like cupin family protein